MLKVGSRKKSTEKYKTFELPGPGTVNTMKYSIDQLSFSDLDVSDRMLGKRSEKKKQNKN